MRLACTFSGVSLFTVHKFAAAVDSFFGSDEKIDWVIPDNLLALNPGNEGFEASGGVLVTGLPDPEL